MREQYGDNQFGKVSQLSLTAAARNGRTYLEDVYFTAPYKMMRPFEKEDGGIQVMPLCASAGIMKGDVQRFEYNVGTGADMEVLSQSFEKIHRMDGGCARREVTAKVESDASLYYYPQPMIPFAGSAFESEMEIKLADETSFLFMLDIISCGRTAREERFEYRKFASEVRVYRGEKLIYRDNTCYEPEKMPMEAVGMYEGYSHLANLFITTAAFDAEETAQLQEEIWQIIEADSECEGGVTRLAAGDLAVRVFGNRAQKLQQIAEKIKSLL